LKRTVIKTADGSTTIHLEAWGEHYHSHHGAIQEAYHVFIKNGLDMVSLPQMRILEIGFGTGLNAYITYLEAEKRGLSVYYEGVEAYPVSEEEITQLNYTDLLEKPLKEGVFEQLHSAPWEEDIPIVSFFTLKKRKQFFEEISDTDSFELIYFDAFGARVQPDLWTEAIFRKMFHALLPGGVLVTYASKGSVRRAMQEVGFLVEKLPGPPGKREMLRAVKPQKP